MSLRSTHSYSSSSQRANSSSSSRLPSQAGNGPFIVMSCYYKTQSGQEVQDEGERIIRLERVSDLESGGVNHRDVQYCPTDGPFNSVIVSKRALDPLPVVSKPHAKGHFFAYTESLSNSEQPPRRERRELRFWFYKHISQDDRKALATEFFKILIEPETFPRGFGMFVRKLIVMIQHYRMIRRLELFVNPAPEPPPELEEWEIYEEQPIENYITVLTPAVYDYQYLPEVPVSKKTSVSFKVRAGADAHVALSNVYGEVERKTYEVVLGAANNTRSQIRYGGRGPVESECETRNILDTDEFKPFWLSWDNKCLKVGRGTIIGESSFLQWHIPPRKLHSINLMSVSTGPGSDGQWEFVEYLERVTAWSNSRAAKRRWVRRALVWYAKKTKMLESLEHSFPQSLDTQELLRLSTVSLAEMLEAVVFLKDLLKKGSVLEVSKGIWLRSPLHKSDSAHEMKLVEKLPNFSTERDQPTILILSTMYCEQVAVESMIEKKISYVKYSVNEKTQVYTVGKIGEYCVLSVKLSRPTDTDINPTSKYSEILSQIAKTFSKLEHVIVLSVGGGVPDYSEFSRHIRRGDVAVSVARREGGIQYIHCEGVEQDVGGGSPSYSTSTFSSADDLLQSVAKQISEYTSRGYDRPIWEKYLEKSEEVLSQHDSSYHRPAAKTDKLYAVLDGESEPVLIKHPLPPPDKQYMYKENTPTVRLGPIASGHHVAQSEALRMEFSACNGDVVAYDRGLHHLIEALTESSLNSFLVVLGIADYRDGGKTRTWQPYSALSAAAYIKNLILSLKAFTRRRSSYYH